MWEIVAFLVVIWYFRTSCWWNFNFVEKNFFNATKVGTLMNAINPHWTLRTVHMWCPKIKIFRANKHHFHKINRLKFLLFMSLLHSFRLSSLIVEHHLWTIFYHLINFPLLFNIKNSIIFHYFNPHNSFIVNSIIHPSIHPYLYQCP